MMSEIDEAKKMKGEDPCWDDYKMIGTKNKGGKQVPNCVPEEVEHTDESRQVYYINSHKNQDPAVAQAKKIRKMIAKKHIISQLANKCDWILNAYEAVSYNFADGVLCSKRYPDIDSLKDIVKKK